MRKFKLIKDIPDFEAGTIFEEVAGNICKTPTSDGSKIFFMATIERNPDFFQEIIEQPKVWTDDDMLNFAHEVVCNVRNRTCGAYFPKFANLHKIIDGR